MTLLQMRGRGFPHHTACFTCKQTGINIKSAHPRPVPASPLQSALLTDRRDFTHQRLILRKSRILKPRCLMPKLLSLDEPLRRRTSMKSSKETSTYVILITIKISMKYDSIHFHFSTCSSSPIAIPLAIVLHLDPRPNSTLQFPPS
jgi:hypothetical protein